MRAVLFNPSEGFDAEKVITNHSPIDLKTKKFTEDGLFSTRIFGNNDGSVDVYCCDCGATRGKFNLNEMCHTCSTTVKLQSSNISSVGWIDLQEYFIINPIFYYHIKKIVGGKMLEEILSYQPKLSLDGIQDTESVSESNMPYAHIGMIEFREKFWEILEYFYKGKDNLTPSMEFLQDHEDKIFMHSIPVYSSLLRPAMLIGKKFNFAEENGLYNALIKMSNSLHKKRKLEKIMLSVLPMLYEIQETMNTLAEKIISNFSGKHGFYRENILGNRLNFSGRMVIGPINVFNDYKLNDIELPYLAALEIYKFEIIKVLSATMSIERAEHKWWEATLEFDQTVYSVMEELVKRTKGGLQSLINRNPTIDFGSIQQARVASIKKSYNDFTLGLLNLLLALFNGDYDGDVFNYVSLKDQALREFFKPLRTQAMLIDRNNGRFNRKCSLDKDYALGLQSFLS